MVFNGCQLFRSREVMLVEASAPFGALFEHALALRGLARLPIPALNLAGPTGSAR